MLVEIRRVNNLITMSTRHLFAFVLCAIVAAITVLALLGIWNVIEWSYVQKYFWKSIQSFVIILIGSVVIYLIQAILGKPETRNTNNS